jgi:two-component system response regulator ChvI
MDPPTEMPFASTSRPKSVHGAPRPVKVIAVDDDPHFLEMLAQELEARGFAVETFLDAQALLAQCAVAAPAAEAIVLDWMMPHLSGIELLSQLRRLGINLPVIFLTGKALTAHEVLALERGALDFVDKSRGIDIFIQRLRLIVQPKVVPELQPENLLQCGRLLLKPRIKRAFWANIDLGLTVGEFAIVHLLAENIGHHVAYRQIYDRMRYEGFVAGHGNQGFHMNVRSAIKRIRNKFRALDPEFSKIENSIALGYMWRKDG